VSRLRDGDGVNNRAGGEGEGQGCNDKEFAHDRNSICCVDHIAKMAPEV
jgi:hypothetical protein